VELSVLFPKIGFPEDKYEVKRLFQYRNFNETQKKVKCKVLINYNQIRETTLAELSQFMDEIKEGKHSQYDIPIEFHYSSLNQNIKKTVINNESQFARFLSYLYCLYRKIEVKLEKAEYPNVLPDLDSQGKSFEEISSNLKKAKDDYKLVNKNDLVAIYIACKKLFSCYTHYIKYSIDNFIDINEGDLLPITIEEIKPLLEKLNVWSPVKVNNQWITYINLIVIPPGYERVAEVLYKTNKFKHFQVIIDNEIEDPYIMEGDGKQTFFGFADMIGAIEEGTPYDDTVFQSQCPGKCSSILRRWICTKCGQFIFRKDHTLFCSCGSKKIRTKTLKMLSP